MKPELSNEDFNWVTKLFEGKTGIHLGREKETLVVSRLMPRLRARGLEKLADYLSILKDPGEEQERTVVINQLTTHETYFFREPQHFIVLQKYAKENQTAGPFRVWSAASSTGEEAATIALVLEESNLPGGYQIVGTDVAPDVVRKAQACVFPLDRAQGINQQLLQRHCLRGVGEADGTFRLKEEIKKRMDFRVGNLLESQPALGKFDVIFLRNVLIYFDDARRTRIVKNVLENLKPGGLLLPGHSESVRECSPALKSLGPAVYRYEPAGVSP